MQDKYLRLGRKVIMGLFDSTVNLIKPKYSVGILRNYFFVPIKEVRNLERVKEELTVTSKYDINKRVALYVDNNEWFGFPKYHFKDPKSMGGQYTDLQSDGSPIHFNHNVKLWDYQQKAIDEFNTLRDHGVTGVFLGAKPGAGKTTMGIQMIKLLGCTALVVVPKKDLIYQWKDRFLKDTDLKEEDIGILMAGKKEWRNKKVVIGTVHTIAADKLGEEFRNYFGVTLYDESDNTIPPTTFSPAASMMYGRFRIGMTASKTRADGMESIVREHVSQAEINCVASNTMTGVAIMVMYNGNSGEVPYHVQGLPKLGMLNSMLAVNQERNELVARYARMCYDEDRGTLIISNRKQQLKDIRDILIRGGVLEREIGYYCASMDGKTFKKQELKQVADNCRIILGTYGMIGRGTDIPRLSALVLATPQVDLRQVKGRIERAMPGKQQPVVIDIVDSYYFMLHNAGNARVQQYRETNMEVRLMD